MTKVWKLASTEASSVMDGCAYQAPSLAAQEATMGIPTYVNSEPNFLTRSQLSRPFVKGPFRSSTDGFSGM